MKMKKKLYCNLLKGPCEFGSFNLCYQASLVGGGCKYGVEEKKERDDDGKCLESEG